MTKQQWLSKTTVLTYGIAKDLGLHKQEHITPDMLDGFERVDQYAFAHDNILQTIDFPDSLWSIGHHSFYLEQVTLGKNTLYIAHYTFYKCKKLKCEIKIPKTLDYIGHSAFQNTGISLYIR